MTYREVAMWEILNVLCRAGRGETTSAIARTTGHSRSTIRRYLAEAAAPGWRPGAGAPTDDLAAAIGRRLHPARDRGLGEIEAVPLGHLEEIRAWLAPPPTERRGLQLTKVHQLLARRGVQVPYSSLHRFAVKHCGLAARHLTVRMSESAPGEVAEIDFGRLGLVWDPLRERSRVLWALVVILALQPPSIRPYHLLANGGGCDRGSRGRLALLRWGAAAAAVRMSNCRIPLSLRTDAYMAWWERHRTRRTRKEIAGRIEPAKAKEIVKLYMPQM